MIFNKKKAFMGLLLSAAFIITLSQCTSDLEFENLDQDLQSLNEEFIAVLESDHADCFDALNQITSDGSMLSFQDSTHFSDTEACIENLVAAYNDLYLVKFDHLTVEELDSLDESLGFDEDYILSYIATNNNYISKSLEISSLVETWLDQENPDWENDPNAANPLGQYTSALVNTNCEVNIAGVVYDLCAETGSSSFDDKLDGKRIYRNCRSGNGLYCCRVGTALKNWSYAGNSKHVNYELKFISRNFPRGINVYGKATHYKKKRRRWKKSRAHMTANIDAQWYGPNCDYRDNYNQLKSTRRRGQRSMTVGFYFSINGGRINTGGMTGGIAVKPSRFTTNPADYLVEGTLGI